MIAIKHLERNQILALKFELAYKDFAAQHINHLATEIPLLFSMVSFLCLIAYQPS